MKIRQKITGTADGRGYVLMAALAFFHFVFLGTEYLFDDMMALVTEPARVVTAQGYVLGASVLGFLLYPAVISGMERKRERAVADLHTIRGTGGMLPVFAGALAGIICIFVMWQHASYGMLLIAGCLCFILLGMGGSAVHYGLSLAVKERYLAKTVGVSYGVGICLQFLNHQLVQNDMAESVVLAVSAAVFAVLLLRAGVGQERTETLDRSVGNEDISARAGLWLILLVILLTCIFSTLDAAVTLVHAAGAADVGQWPRLLLAGSGLLAGVLFDGWEHRVGNMLMYCVTILSVLCIVILDNGGAFWLGLAVFYLSAGFFVVFFTASFMRLSKYEKCPQLWAGLGRAVNNLCAFWMGPMSVALLRSDREVLRTGTLLVLLVLISLAFFFYTNAAEMGNAPGESRENVREPARDEVRRMEAFAEDFSLTEREKEVLRVLLVSEENVQDIAEQLLISRAALYRHIASLNEKTGTKSRIGLVQFYYTYQGRTENEKKADL